MAWLWPLTLQFLTKPRWSGGINQLRKKINREEGRGIPSESRNGRGGQADEINSKERSARA